MVHTRTSSDVHITSKRYTYDRLTTSVFDTVRFTFATVWCTWTLASSFARLRTHNLIFTILSLKEAAEPENATAITIDEHSIELRWVNNPANGDYRIEVYRAIPEAEDFTAIVNVSSDSSSYLQQGLDSGALYIFSIAQYFAGHLGQKAEFIANITSKYMHLISISGLTIYY